MGGAVGGLVSGVGDLVGGAVDTVSNIVDSDLGKAALIGGGLYATGGLSGLGLGGGTALTGVDAAMADLAAGSSGFGASAGGAGLLGGALDWAKANPLTAGAGALALAGGLGGSQPTSSTTTTAIDPQMKAAYLRNLEEARTTAAGLGEKQFADFTGQYGTAEQQLESLGLGGAGQKTTNEAVRLALQEAGYTPQQIAAATAGETNLATTQGYTPQQINALSAGDANLALSQGYTPEQIAAAQINRQNVANVTGGLGSQFMGAYQNPYESQVVQGALGDIERQRRIQQQAGQTRATAAKAFGGSRQAVAEALANEDYTRQAANTAAQLRSQGFTTAAQLGQTDAARLLQAQLANQGVDVSLAQANAQLLQQGRLANQAAINQAGQFGAASANQAALANAAARNQMAQYNAQLGQQGLLANQAAINQASQFGAASGNQAALANAAARNQMAQYNAQLAQQAALANQAAFAQGAGIRQAAIGQLGALGAQQQNLGMTGAQAVMNAQQQRQALAQARLDAARNLPLERLGISQAALGMQPANLGGTTTSPIYRNTSASALGGALSGGMLGNLIGGPTGALYGAAGGGLLGLL